MRRERFASWVLTLLMATSVSAVWAAGSPAAMVTVGAPLPINDSENFSIGCGSSCLLSNPTAPNGGSDVSPVDGVIVRWRLYHARPPAVFWNPAYRLRVISPVGNKYLGAGTSASSVPFNYAPVERFSTHLPIKAGELVGLELQNSDSNVHFGFSSAATSVFLEPAMADGETGEPSTAWENGFIFPFNADVLPPPVIGGISPTGGSFTTPNQVTITGDNLAEVRSVSFGATQVHFKFHSESTLTATAPPSPILASVPVTVVTAAGSASAPHGYSYEGCVVPMLRDRKLRSVKNTLSRHKCTLGHVARRHRATAESGRVKRQSPHPGVVLPPGGEVQVTLGLDPAPAQ